jgi:aminoglycoside 3-N-acetyltransferase I
MIFATRRLRVVDRAEARLLFRLLTEVFKEERAPLSDRYLDQLLARDDFWAIAAFSGQEIIGGATAHTLPMTRHEAAEILIYDVAVVPNYRRKGIGRQLVEFLRQSAGSNDVDSLFVMAETQDEHALDFYRRLGGIATATTVFGFSGGTRHA